MSNACLGSRRDQLEPTNATEIPSAWNWNPAQLEFQITFSARSLSYSTSTVGLKVVSPNIFIFFQELKIHKIADKVCSNLSTDKWIQLWIYIRTRKGSIQATFSQVDMDMDYIKLSRFSFCLSIFTIFIVHFHPYYLKTQKICQICQFQPSGSEFLEKKSLLISLHSRQQLTQIFCQNLQCPLVPAIY